MTDHIAFRNDPDLALAVRTQVEAHEQADEIIQGAYWENGKGCFIGCLVHGSDVLKVRDLTGFPIALTRIAEGIFEGLPNDVAKGFPGRVVNAPRVGADLNLVTWKFLHWVVTDGIEQFGTPAVREGCKAAVQVLEDRMNGKNVTTGAVTYAARAADAVASAARTASAARAASAVASAARAARAADAAYAARAADAASAADAADAVASAADAADAVASAAYAASAVASAARAASAASARIRQANKLVELLEAA